MNTLAVVAGIAALVATCGAVMTGAGFGLEAEAKQTFFDDNNASAASTQLTIQTMRAVGIAGAVMLGVGLTAAIALTVAARNR